MNGKNGLRVLGVLATVIGAVSSLMSSWVDEQKMNKEIDKKVDEALAKRNEGS